VRAAEEEVGLPDEGAAVVAGPGAGEGALDHLVAAVLAAVAGRELGPRAGEADVIPLGERLGATPDRRRLAKGVAGPAAGGTARQRCERMQNRMSIMVFMGSSWLSVVSVARSPPSGDASGRHPT
jgi:hypothetical protein